MKVFGTMIAIRGLPEKYRNLNGSTQKRVVAAVRSRAEFARLVGISNYEAAGYSSETGNDEELAICLANPGKVFYQPEDYRKNFLPLPECQR